MICYFLNGLHFCFNTFIFSIKYTFFSGLQSIFFQSLPSCFCLRLEDNGPNSFKYSPLSTRLTVTLKKTNNHAIILSFVSEQFFNLSRFFPLRARWERNPIFSTIPAILPSTWQYCNGCTLPRLFGRRWLQLLVFHFFCFINWNYSGQPN